MDICDGKLAVGFGYSVQIWVFDVSDWSHIRIGTIDYVFSIVIYKDKIVYTADSFDRPIYIYNTTLMSHQTLNIVRLWPLLSINHIDGILYANTSQVSPSSLVFVDLNTMQVIYESAHGQFYTSFVPAFFDGTFVHYTGKTLDKLTGITVSDTDQAREYNTIAYTMISTIYDDSLMSVFTANRDGDMHTVFYDLNTQKITLEIDGEATKAVKASDGFVVFREKDVLVVPYEKLK